MGEEHRVKRQDAFEQGRAQVSDDPLARLGHVEIAEGGRQPQNQGVGAQNQEPGVDVAPAVLKAVVDGPARRRRQPQRRRRREQQPQPGDGGVQPVPHHEGQQLGQGLDVAGLGALAARLLHLLGQQSPGAGPPAGGGVLRCGRRRNLGHSRALAPERPPV
ncbi:hypothetical protein D3C81_1250970 [compost metagenome]